MILLIDNYDSFTYNIKHYLNEVGAEVETYRNDEISIEDISNLKPLLYYHQAPAHLMKLAFV